MPLRRPTVSSSSVKSSSSVPGHNHNGRLYPRAISSPSSESLEGVDDPRTAIAGAYARLTPEQLALFLSIRSLPTDGTFKELVDRLTSFDIEKYSPLHLTPPCSSEEHSPLLEPLKAPSECVPTLPTEILAEIHDHVGDWELAMAVGVRTSLRRPRKWERATEKDEAALSGSLPRFRSTSGTLTKVGAHVIIRFGYLGILDYLRDDDRATFKTHFGQNGEAIPTLASRFGRTNVLAWWLAGDLPRVYEAEAMDDASSHGHIEVLEWWQHSRLAPKYTEASLERASAEGHLAVLTWWKQSTLPLKIGRVMDSASKTVNLDALNWWARSQLDFKYDNSLIYNASCAGRVEVLEWWHQSGLQMMYDREVLIGATRHNRPEVLEWWRQSGLPIQYRICDIEEAIEDAVRSGSECRDWWRSRGVNFNATNLEWMKWHNLD